MKPVCVNKEPNTEAMWHVNNENVFAETAANVNAIRVNMAACSYGESANAC